MDFDFSELSRRAIYRLLVDTVVPRPIAFVTTVNESGGRNAAPFSFFNVMGHDPPIVVLGLEQRRDGRLKDTAANVRATHAFVVNLVSEELAQAMNLCSADLEPWVDEPALVGLEMVPSTRVSVPRLAAAPASLECEEMMSIGLGEGRTLVVGKVLALHVEDRYYDRAGERVRTADMHLVARMHGSGWYARTSDLFLLERPDAAALAAAAEQDRGDVEDR
ncbi:MAG TPA: flavin reductase family protein [Trueperaceae bacterium]|nr:flavin reductase family protein [Trueperaceae bacterium]